MHPPDIFISYAREDEDWVRLLVAELEQRGRTVFWDRRTPTGKRWRSHLDAALARARCVVVVWSHHSIVDDSFVLEEADEGKGRNVLFPVFRHPVRLPLGFRGIHTADLSAWTPGMPASAFDAFLADLGAMLDSSPDEATPTAAGPGLTTADGPAPSQSQVSPAAVPPVVSEPYPGVASECKADGAPERAWVPTPPFVADAPTVVSARVEAGETSPPARDPPVDEHSVPQPEPVDAPARPKFGSAPPYTPPPKRRAGRLAFAALLSAGAIGVGTYVFNLSAERPPATVEAQPAAITPPPTVEPVAPPLATRPAPTQPIPPAKRQYLEPGQMFTDMLADGSPCPFCPEMVVIPAGSFTMGSPPTEADRDDDEGPQREVTITKRSGSHNVAFALGRYEVTFAQWDACVAAAECTSPNDQGWSRGAQPVINVSWQDAQGFATWLSGKTGQPYRLPTEAEWEYAARAGTTSPFWTGSTISTAQANYDGNYTYGDGAKGIYRARTVAVDDPTFPVNPFGLYHMNGNVWEWVQDCYVKGYDEALIRSSSAVEDSDCSERALRGGSWSGKSKGLRSANRYKFAPGDRNISIGFRVARKVTEYDLGLRK